MRRVVAILIALIILAAAFGGCAPAGPLVSSPAAETRLKFYEFYSPT